MSQLNSKFTRDDIDNLIDSVSAWEMEHQHQYHSLQIVKQIPMPPEDHPSYDYIKALKKEFIDRERSIKADQKVNQEKAVFLKAKLMLIRQDMAIDQLFEMATDNTMPIKDSAPVENGSSKPEVPNQTSDDSNRASEKDESDVSVKNDLTPEMKVVMAESFLESISILKNFNEYIGDQNLNIEQKLEKIEYYIKDVGVWENYSKYICKK